jgi:hypothetical protein
MKSTFKILSALDFKELCNDIESHLNEGFKLIDELKYLNNWYIQYMIKEDWRLDEKCACITKEMRDKCIAFEHCVARTCEEEK